MYEMVRLASVSAVLAAAFVLATDPGIDPGYTRLRPALVVTIDDPGTSRPDTSSVSALN